ncbi:MAG: PepSY domain-containing protein [Rhodovibrionaceae bacterium]
MKRKILLSILVCAPLFVGGAFANEPLDPADRGHVSFEEARNKLERQGYTEIKDIDNRQFDAWVEVYATNPDGERVHIKLDNTVGTVISEKPLGN